MQNGFEIPYGHNADWGKVTSGQAECCSRKSN